MPFYVRKISRNKWNNIDGPLEDFPADIFSDLRSTKNTLSVWKIDDKSCLDDAILALCTGSKTEKIEKIDIVIIPEESLNDNDILVISSEGDTLVNDLKNIHCDLSELNYKKLGIIADIISKIISAGEDFKTVGKLHVKEILKKAYCDGRISTSITNSTLICEIKKLFK